MAFTKRVAALAALAAFTLTLSSKSKAADLAPTHIPSTASQAPLTEYHLRMHHLHTGEDIDVVYRIGNTYIPAALEQLDHFLRDHRTEDSSTYDPREFDVLHALMTSLHRPNGVIDIVCGYRTPWSNNLLRTNFGRSRPTQTGVAEHSQHMLAKAIDIRVPGVSTVELRNAALALHAGGVGFYPVSQFVHVDVGPVRTWSFR
ncbi:MAG TPA: DUF882 domain-containing protein [Acidobacteriaceae bacterium]|nr:DUF882 domain-containing protein [Acidobacteriaceae bacterium]